MPFDTALVPSATPSARFTVAFWPIAVPPGAVCCTIAPLPMPMPLSPFTVVCGPMATDSAPMAAESVGGGIGVEVLDRRDRERTHRALQLAQSHRVLILRTVRHVGDLAEIGGVTHGYRAEQVAVRGVIRDDVGADQDRTGRGSDRAIGHRAGTQCHATEHRHAGALAQGCRVIRGRRSADTGRQGVEARRAIVGVVAAPAFRCR